MLEDENGNPIAEEDFSVNSSPSADSDHSWLRTAFVLPVHGESEGFVDPIDATNRYWSSATNKFTDGRFGCNIGINCHPQITAYADVPDPGIFKFRPTVEIDRDASQYGLGPYWSTAFDDPEQIIYMRFGVPEFNSLFNFFANAYDYPSSTFVRTGRIPSVLYQGAKWATQYMMMRAMPMIVIPLILYRTADYFFFRQSAKYFHMRPTMHMYWTAVNNLVNTLVINSGIFPRMLNANEDDTRRLGMPFTPSQDDLDTYHALAPDLFTKENYVDVHAFGNRAQRLANEMMEQEFNELNEGTTTDFAGYLKREYLGKGTHGNRYMNADGEVTLFRLIEHYLNIGDFYKDHEDKVGLPEDPRSAKDETGYNPLYSESTINNFKKMLNAEFKQGGSFAVFRVEATGSKSESFSNATTPSGLENKLNGIASDFQEMRFTGAGIAAMGGEILNKAAGLATDALMGVADGVTMGLASSIKGLMGEGFVEIPEHWQSSSSSLPTAQYKITIDCWNASAITRIFKMFVPFSMIAAGAWPRSVGRQAYGSPFLCQVYDQGRVQVPLGMITEFTVSRGEGNLGFTTNGAPLSMSISFTVKDLSRVLHMPISLGILDVNPSMIDEDSAITNYLATLAGQSMYNQVYPVSKVKIRAAKLAMKAGMLSSPAFWASSVHDNMTNTVLGKLTLAGPLIESFSRNPEATMGSNRF